MAKRKIADCVNIRIKVGDFQHIEIVKYAEEEIEYTNQEERIAKEDSLTDSLVQSVMRSLRAIPEKLGKGKAEAIEVEQRISKAVPAWLSSDPVPNIANFAKKAASTEIDKQMAEKEKAIQTDKKVLLDNSSFSKKVDKVEKVENKDEKDLFEDDTPVKKVEVKPEEKKSSKQDDDGFDIFADEEDLFKTT